MNLGINTDNHNYQTKNPLIKQLIFKGSEKEIIRRNSPFNQYKYATETIH